MKSAQAVRIDLGPSRLAGAIVVIAQIATATMIAWLPVDAWLRVLAVIAVGAAGVHFLRSSSIRSLSSSVIAIELAPDRRVTLFRRDGRRIDGCARADSYVGERLVTLVVRADGKRRATSLWLLPDMAPREELRRFRVLLRLGRPPSKV